MARTVSEEASSNGSIAEQVKARPRGQPAKIKSPNTSLLLPSGSTLLNLACSDDAQGMCPPGSIVNIVGDKSTGKSLLSLAMIAESCHHSKMREYAINYDDTEASLRFPIEQMFGPTVARRINLFEDPSETIEQFDYRFRKGLADGPMLYVLDSLDEVSCDDEIKRVAKADQDREAGREAKGSYKMEKPKMLSQLFRVCRRDAADAGAFLVIISQVRENLEATGPWSPKFRRSGGKALDHNADLVIWLARVKNYKKRDRIVGYRMEAKVDKNKISGKRRTVQFDVWDQYGLDDIGSCIDFLVEEKWWKQSKAGIVASELDLCCPRDSMVSKVEQSNELVKRMHDATGLCWQRIEEEIRIDRKPRYE